MFLEMLQVVTVSPDPSCGTAEPGSVQRRETWHRSFRPLGGSFDTFEVGVPKEMSKLL